MSRDRSVSTRVGALTSACPGALVRTVRRSERFVQALAFWTATLLPLGYFPLLFALPSRTATVSVLGKLFALNVFALLVGHGYRTADDSEDS